MAGLHAIGARTVSMITPYERPLADKVVRYIEEEGVQVLDSIALEIKDNLEVGQRDPLLLLDDLKELQYERADAIVLSACVQLPSLAAIEIAQDRTGKPVISTATCTAYAMLRALDLEPVAPVAGHILSGF